MKRRWNWRPSQWEMMLAILTLAAGVWSAQLSPYYLNLDQIADSTRQFIFPGLLALGLMIVVVLGEIDISLASTLAVGSVLFSKFSAYHVQVWFAFPIVIVVCGLLGALNGRTCRSDSAYHLSRSLLARWVPTAALRLSLVQKRGTPTLMIPISG